MSDIKDLIERLRQIEQISYIEEIPCRRIREAAGWAADALEQYRRPVDERLPDTAEKAADALIALNHVLPSKQLDASTSIAAEALLRDCVTALRTQAQEIERLRAVLRGEAEYCYSFADKYETAGDGARGARHRARGDRLRAALKGDVDE